MDEVRQLYGDLLDREHPVSKKHPRMSKLNRAAQFSPFAALTGYEDLVDEAARYTGQKRELDEAEKEVLNQKLLQLMQQPERTEATFTFFQPDTLKLGGKYKKTIGAIIHYDDLIQCITLDSGVEILIDDIIKIESQVFPDEML